MPTELHLVDWLLTPRFPAEATKIQVRLGANLSMRRGTILGEYQGAYGVYGPYGANNRDGTNVARLILEMDCATDGDGYVTFASLVVDEGMMWDRKFDRVNAFMNGTFDCRELVGLDAAAVLQLGRLLSGTVSNGVLHVR